MSLSIGIVGLPNVGKSTLFTALTKKTGLAANYPFATIDPNVGIVDVPDSRLQKLADIVNPGRIVPATVEFVDIAGLVKGANEGEGLGNQFLANIRETDAICEVVRYFKDPNVMREVGRTGEFVDPAGDADTIMTELILADMGTLEKQLPKLEKEAKRDKELMPKFEVAKRLLAWLNEGKRAASMEMTDEERAAAKGLFLLTMKPILYVANVDEDMLNDDLAPIDRRQAAAHLRQDRGRAFRARSRGRRRLPGEPGPGAARPGRARSGCLQAARPAVVLYGRRDGGQGLDGSSGCDRPAGRRCHPHRL